MQAGRSSITFDPNTLAGKPVIRGSRLSVEFMIGLMAGRWHQADVLPNYPEITREGILTCLSDTSETPRCEKDFPSAGLPESSATMRY